MEPSPELSKRERWELKQQQKEQFRQRHLRQRTMRKLFPWLAVGAVVALLGLSLWRNAGPAADGTLPGDPVAIAADDWVKGEPNAPVTVVEYSDFQCPACAAYFPVVKQLLEANPGKIRFVYRHFPLSSHRHAVAAAQAAEAAGRQGQFWAMHDRLFAEQKTWAAARDPREQFLGYAEGLQLDGGQFLSDYDDPALRERVDRDRRSGDRLAVRSTPSFFLNGQKISNPGSLEAFQALVDAAYAAAPLPTPTPGEAYHAHADLAVYLNGKTLDFSDAKFQSTKDKELNAAVHLHAGKGTVLHAHQRGVTLATFFESLGMELTDTCLTLDDEKKYCTDGKKSLKLYANGKAIADQFGEYVFADLDRILVSFGSETDAQLNKQLDAVSDVACIYSETCPERGKPPEEECVGGLGTGCE